MKKYITQIVLMCILFSCNGISEEERKIQLAYIDTMYEMSKNLPLEINENLQKMTPLDISKDKGELIRQLLQIKVNELKGVPDDVELKDVSLEDTKKALEEIYKRIRIYRRRIEQLEEIDTLSNLKEDALVFLDTLEEHFRKHNVLKVYEDQQQVFPDAYLLNKESSNHYKKLLFDLRKKLIEYHQFFDVHVPQSLLDQTKYFPI